MVILGAEKSDDMLKRIAGTFIILLIVTVHNGMAQDVCPVIPLPAHALQTKSVFRISNTTAIVVTDHRLLPSAEYLGKQLQQLTGIRLARKPIGKQGYIALSLQARPASQQHAYAVEMTEQGVNIRATDPESVFNGVITLLQMAAQAAQQHHKSLVLPCWNIKDAPRYEWRGLMLDESRHFFGKEVVKQLLDQMAFYKLNRFHWHLTDEPAWRLEIKKYPQLALKGGRGSQSDSTAPAQYYTQEDIHEIVAYAQKRYIVVIPEIDMPGHATAANKAYPEFSGGGSKSHPEFTFDPGNEDTYTYLTAILKEVKTLFPSGMVHLGGDEVSFGNDRWKDNPGIKTLMQDKGLHNNTEVEQYFIRRMADSAVQMQQTVIGWDEVAHAGLASDKTIVCWWRQEKPDQLSAALQQHYKVILCPRLPFYFDFVQDSADKKGRKWNKQYNSLEQVYNFSQDHLPVTITNPQQVLGIQANLWTETVKTRKRLEYMLFPRLCALAEAAWTTNGRKDYKGFEVRLQHQLSLLRQAGIYYYDPQNPHLSPEPLQ